MSQFFFKEIPNKYAKIAFFVWDPLQYYIYKNVIKYLPQAEFVVCDKWYNTIRDRGTAHIDEIIELLDKDVSYWRVITELNDPKKIKDLLDKYEIIISTHMWPPLTILPTEDWFYKKKTIRMLDGCGKGLATFAPWSAYFDIALAYGPYTEKYLSLLNKTYTVGNPKFDQWFSNKISRQETELIKTKLDPRKKTLLYLPTHGGLSSLHRFVDSILSLEQKYNIIVKLHRHNKLSEKELITPFFKGNITIFDSKDDMLPLLHLADFVISDSSSAALETLLVDRPMVILDTETSNRKAWKEHAEGTEFNGFWFSGGLEYTYSAGWQLRQIFSKFGLVVQDPHKLEFTIERILEKVWGTFNNERDEFRNFLFAYNDGKCGKRAADIIQKILTQPRPTPPLLGAAIRSYFPILGKNYKLSREKMYKELKNKDKIINNFRAQLKLLVGKYSENKFQRILYLTKLFWNN